MSTTLAPRQYTCLDLILHSFGQMLAQFQAKPITSQYPTPPSPPAEVELTSTEQRLSAALMRVNHAGEVCAQGLYLGQALFAKQASLKHYFLTAALEEEAHLSWCQQRLLELNSHPSYLTPFWYITSFSLGVIAGLWSDPLSLGFLEETEKQVIEHLESHLALLPKNDTRSQAILSTMQQDEARHAMTAQVKGSHPLPWPIPSAMRWTAKIMTKTAYYF